jgi:hypothetical protein
MGRRQTARPHQALGGLATADHRHPRVGHGRAGADGGWAPQPPLGPSPDRHQAPGPAAIRTPPRLIVIVPRRRAGAGTKCGKPKVGMSVCPLAEAASPDDLFAMNFAPHIEDASRSPQIRLVRTERPSASCGRSRPQGRAVRLRVPVVLGRRHPRRSGPRRPALRADHRRGFEWDGSTPHSGATRVSSTAAAPSSGYLALLALLHPLHRTPLESGAQPSDHPTEME